MAEATGDRAPDVTRAAKSGWQRWPDWAGYVASVWSLGYGLLILGLYWVLGSAGFPFGEGDRQSALSIFHGVQAETGAPIIAALGLVGGVVAMAMAWTWGRGLARVVLLAFAWTAAAVLALVIPDYRVLMAVAYAPILLIGAPFGWPPGVSILDAFPWPVVNQFFCIAGGLVWAATAVVYQQRSRDARANGGRTDAHWTRPAAAARWGKWATYVAVVIPLLYAATRWAWALGIPLGISEEFLREGEAMGAWWAGAGLATVAIGGAILTLGLIQKWGEVFPRWIPYLAGRRVPLWFAVVPAVLVAIIVTNAGLMFVRLTLTGALDAILGAGVLSGENWAALAPELLWPVWGAALGAATLAYYYRRRGAHAGSRVSGGGYGGNHE